MPLITPNVNTNIDAPTINNPNRDALLRLLGIGMQTGGEIAGKMASNKQESDLTSGRAKGYQADAAAFSKTHPNTNYQTGDKGTEISHDYLSSMLMQQDKATREDKGKLDASYKSTVQPYVDRVESGNQLMSSIKNGTTLGDKAAAILAARNVEGKSARLQLPVIKEFQNADAQSQAKGFWNWLSSQNTSNLSPDSRAALSQVGQQISQAASDDYKESYNRFVQQAPFTAPNMHRNGKLGDVISTYASPMTQSRMQNAQSVGQDAAQNKLPPGPSNNDPSNPMQQAATGAKAGLSSLLGLSQQGAGSAQPSSQDAAAPLTPAEAARLEELRTKYNRR